MSEEELQLLITLDDPEVGPEEDTFDHLQVRATLEYWLGQRFQLDQRAEAVTFGEGEWTCTLSRFATTSVSTKFDIEFCTVTHRKNGEIVEQKVFYDLVGMQKSLH